MKDLAEKAFLRALQKFLFEITGNVNFSMRLYGCSMRVKEKP